MTVIAAMHCGESVLMAADSRVVEDGMRLCERKLDWLPPGSPLVAWGFSGDEAIGRDFGRILKVHVAKLTSWDAVVDEAGNILSQLNGRRRMFAEQARVQISQGGCSVLLAGYVGDAAGILELDGAGGYTFSDRFASIGSGRMATMVYRVLQRLEPSFPHDYDGLKRVIDLVVNLSDEAASPVRIIQVRRGENVTVLLDEIRPDSFPRA